MTGYFAEVMYWRRLTENNIGGKFTHWVEASGGRHSRMYLCGGLKAITEFFKYSDLDGGPDGTIRVEPVEKYDGMSLPGGRKARSTRLLSQRG